MSPKLVDGLAAVSSIAAGGIMYWREVLSESYANFTQLDLVDDIKDTYRKKFGPDFVKNFEQAKGEISTEQATKVIVDQNKAYNKAISERFKEYGFDKFSNRMQLLNSHEKWKIGLTALAVTGVSLGSLLLLTRDMFKKNAKKTDEEMAPSISPRPDSYTEAERKKSENSPTISL